MEALIVDTSVVVKWYAVPREGDFERARMFLQARARRSCHLHVPALLFYEVGNVFAQSPDRIPARERATCLADLFALELETHPLTLPRALLAADVAQAFGISFYDAAFVALAQELALPFVTADARLCRQVATLPGVHSLASFRLDS